MTDEQINEAIASECEWEPFSDVCLGEVIKGWRNPKHPFRSERPDYVHDLNAAHEAEAWLLKKSQEAPTDILWRTYTANLERRVGVCIVFHANARQRSEEFLRTLGKLKD